MRLRLGVSSAVLLLVPGIAIPNSPASAVHPACANPTIVGTSGNDQLIGTHGPDVIAGGRGGDTIDGLGGDDILCGGEGSDTLVGGEGNDALHGENDERYAGDEGYWIYLGDRLSGGPGDDLLDPGVDPRSGEANDELIYEASATAVTVDLLSGTATGEGTDTISGTVTTVVGSNFDDTLLGSDGDDDLSGALGSDYLDGRRGDDQLSAVGFVEGPLKVESAGNVVIGGPGSDTLWGDDGDDVLRGKAGSDSLYGRGGLDASYGGPGNDDVSDIIEYGSSPRLVGGAGRDTLDAPSPAFADHSRDFNSHGSIDLLSGVMLTGFEGTLTRIAVIGFEHVNAPYGKRWNLYGTHGRNRLKSDSPVRIYARGGPDHLVGSSGHDVLHGGSGHDSLSTSEGDDKIQSIEEFIEPSAL